MPQGNKHKSFYEQRYEKFFGSVGALLFRLAPEADSGSSLGTGERAELRRMNAVKDTVRPPIFWRLLNEYEIITPDLDLKDDQMTKAWAAILNGMALTADICRGASDDFGRALGAAEGGESLARRFDQLMRSDGDRFYDLLRLLLRLAVSKNCAFSWRELARLCLAVGDGNDSERRISSERLTKSFYLALWGNSSNKDNGAAAE